MERPIRCFPFVLAAAFVWLPGLPIKTVAAAGRVQRNSTERVHELFENRCLECHGSEQREGGLLLTNRAAALAATDSGSLAIVPGDATTGTLLARVNSTDEDLRMPPEGGKLTSDEIALLAQWITEGARWPDESERVSHWAYRAPVPPPLPNDHSPWHSSWSQNALDRFVLRRLRLSDLQPSVQEEPARLLRRVYLDLIGVPPTPQTVDAFVANPSEAAYEAIVDRLLASPLYGPKWARRWLDLARYSDSNGYQADQIRNIWAYRDWVIDAMNHDLGFDRFTIEQLAGDLLPDATHAQQIATGFHRATTCNVEAGVDPEGNRTDQVIDRVNTTATVWLGTTLECAQCHNHKYDPFTQKEYYQLFAFFNNTPMEVRKASGVQFNFWGPKMELAQPPEKASALQNAKDRLATLQADRKLKEHELRKQHADWLEQLTAVPRKELPDNIANLLEKERTKAEDNKLRDHFISGRPEIAPLDKRIDEVSARLHELQPDTTLVMLELNQPRKTTVFMRGNFLEPGTEVAPNVPGALHGWPPQQPKDRLGFARWLVDPANPLMSRVTVNRWWSEIFGRGLVSTIEDFGTQGEPPSHPELLDWLAVELMESGWSRKHLHRLMVTSATYRQSSRATRDRLAADPTNRLLSRGPRFRLAAETIRDNALAVGGLISHKMGGPPVYPPQPGGLWNQTGRNEPVYTVQESEDRFRRGIYVVWRRAAPYPSFVSFDGPDRMTCVVQRSRTNTPLQALTLLNDEAYVEIARAFARRIVEEKGGQSLDEQLRFAWKVCLSREPNDQELRYLRQLYLDELTRLEEDAKAVEQLLKSEQATAANPVSRAAWMCVGQVLLNLDETINKG